VLFRLWFLDLYTFQTLPLKSNLKKTGQKLQWHDPNDGGINRASLEELRV
jgi:hypothetical protein